MRKSKKAGKIISGCINVILGIVLVLCIGITAQVLTRGYASCFGFSMFRVVTGSMEPTLHIGTVLVSRDVDINTVQKDDIICFKSLDSAMRGQSVTHRVVSVMKDGSGEILLETRGDANSSADGSLVRESNFIGKVIWYSKGENVGTVILGILSNRIGFLACVLFPCLLCAGIVMSHCVRNIKREMDEALRQLEKLENEQQGDGETQSLSVYDVFTPEEIEAIREQVLEELMIQAKTEREYEDIETESEGKTE